MELPSKLSAIWHWRLLSFSLRNKVFRLFPKEKSGFREGWASSRIIWGLAMSSAQLRHFWGEWHLATPFLKVLGEARKGVGRHHFGDPCFRAYSIWKALSKGSTMCNIAKKFWLHITSIFRFTNNQQGRQCYEKELHPSPTHVTLRSKHFRSNMRPSYVTVTVYK